MEQCSALCSITYTMRTYHDKVPEPTTAMHHRISFIDLHDLAPKQQMPGRRLHMAQALLLLQP
jgi:hypothetical protein